jgi:1,4-alpha-glucan branching enzyme
MSTPDKKKKTKKAESENFSLFSDLDIYLFKEGKHYRLYEKLGSHPHSFGGKKGTYFAVWAPAASHVSLIGDFNAWNKSSHPMQVRWDGSGIWEIFVPGIGVGEVYKYNITHADSGESFEKFDPFARLHENPPRTASVVWADAYKWKDKKWMTKRHEAGAATPVSVYEIHPGSWRRVPEEGNRYLSYREMAVHLVSWIKQQGYTHVEFLPLTEHPFYGSWGYQSVGYFAPTSRYGNPDDLKFLIDELHQNQIGVILDWVPSHFPEDAFALAKYDGSCLFEYADTRKGYHPDWKSLIFNYSRFEVRSFLISSAHYWLEQFHIDGLRVDAVASMLYLDYSRNAGEWEPNIHGGNENLEAISFLRELNASVKTAFPSALMIAEESTAWPGVTASVEQGGLGFDMKWMMGWMHDTLKYFSLDPVYRSYNQNQITFSLHYAFSEKFCLPFSHDEVVHGKGSILNRMPGDEWQRFANLRLLYAYMFTHPGSKLLFMGADLAQEREWNHESSIDWHLLQDERRQKLASLIATLNLMYVNESALHQYQFTHQGFEWIDIADHQNSVISYLRKSDEPQDTLMMVASFTPVPRNHYRLGVPSEGPWEVVLNSDDNKWGGSGSGSAGLLQASAEGSHGRSHSLVLDLPPLGMLILRAANNKADKPKRRVSKKS